MATKKYHNMKEMFLLGDIKKNTLEFLSQCQNIQKVKLEPQMIGVYMQRIERTISKS